MVREIPVVLIGESSGLVMNSRANALTRTSDSDRHIGGLVGTNTGMIINSHATGDVISAGTQVGGLSGRNGGKIINSYATGNVAGSDWVGGLVGWNAASSAEIRNSYATGNVASSDSSPFGIGGLVGGMINNSKVTNSYAIGRVSSSDGRSGALIGRHWGNANDAARDVTYSYWNSETAGQSVSEGGSGRTTRQLQLPTGATGIYAKWRVSDWDFGSSSQYPVLKYAQNPDPEGRGQIITPQLRSGLIALTLTGDDQLFPPFEAEIEYSGIANSVDTVIRLIPTTLDANAEITLYRDDGKIWSQIGTAFVSGTPSPEIMLDEDRINIIVIEIKPSDAAAPIARHFLYLRYSRSKPAIDSLEDLYNIRNNPDSEYTLTRNLDFADDASYDDATTNKTDYTVADFTDDSDLGWLPILGFSGTFNGKWLYDIQSAN